MATEILIDISPFSGHESVQIITLNGEIDESNLSFFKEKLEPFSQDDSTKVIILNLKNLRFINSKVIGFLASYYSTLSQKGKKMIFTEANPNIMDILSLVGLTNIIAYHETQSDALKASLIQ